MGDCLARLTRIAAFLIASVTKMQYLALFSLLAASSVAVPTVLHTSGHKFPKWHPPSYDDVRSPCPALNTLANHGILPRSGRGLATDKLIESMLNIYNISEDLGRKLSLAGLKTSDDPDSGIFDLNDLSKHGIIEHDVSLSRGDQAVTGDNHSFNQTIFDKTMKDFGPSAYTSIKTAAKARYHREQASRKENKDLNFGDKQKETSYQEMSLLLGGLGDIKDGVVSLEYVRIWFEEERLPIAEGWKVPSAEVSPDSLQAMVERLMKATPGEDSSGLTVQTELKV